MEDFRKMVATPYESRGGPSQEITTMRPPASDHEPSIKPRSHHAKPGQGTVLAVEKLMRQLKIILKLARIDAYNLEGQIKDTHGQYMSRSDIIHLLQHVMTTGKLLVGEAEFIDIDDDRRP